MKMFFFWFCFSFFTQMLCWYYFFRTSYNGNPFSDKLDLADRNMQRFFDSRDYWKLAAENPYKRIYREIIEEKAYYDKRAKIEKKENAIEKALGANDTALWLFHILWFFAPFILLFLIKVSNGLGISVWFFLLYFCSTLAINLFWYAVMRSLFDRNIFCSDFQENEVFHKMHVDIISERSEAYLTKEFEYMDEDYLDNISTTYFCRWNHVENINDAKKHKLMIIYGYFAGAVLGVFAPISLALILLNVVLYFVRKKKNEKGH